MILVKDNESIFFFNQTKYNLINLARQSLKFNFRLIQLIVPEHQCFILNNYDDILIRI